MVEAYVNRKITYKKQEARKTLGSFIRHIPNWPKNLLLGSNALRSTTSTPLHWGPSLHHMTHWRHISHKALCCIGDLQNSTILLNETLYILTMAFQFVPWLLATTILICFHEFSYFRCHINTRVYSTSFSVCLLHLTQCLLESSML
jgi:hypothetical protein